MKQAANLCVTPLITRRTSFAFLFTSFFLFILNISTPAQDNTLYLMPVIPQANQLNPALMYGCRIYVSLPVISSVKLNIRNTGFGFHDVLHTGTGAQSGIYYLDLASLARKLKRINYFRTDLDIDLLGFGFALKGWYFTFGISNHTELRVPYPHDIATLKDGNWEVSQGKAIPITLSGLGVDLTIWNSIGISAAKELREGLQAGLRLKYLQGMANINTRSSQLELNTTSNPITLEAAMKYRLNASFPADIGYSANGFVNKVNFDNSLNNIPGDFIFNGNRGVAVDAGIVYDFDEITQITASIVDLGFIWWRKNVNNFAADGRFTFTGIDLDQYQLNPGQTDFFHALQDSISHSFKAAGSTKSYFTANSVKIFGGVTRELMPKLKAGAMTRIEVYDFRIRPSLSLSLNYIPIPAVAVSLSYTIMNYKLNQVGAGMAFGNRLAQFYILADNIPVRFIKDSGSWLFWPYNARMISLRFGLNLLFGCREKENSVRGHTPARNKICPAYW